MLWVRRFFVQIFSSLLLLSLLLLALVFSFTASFNKPAKLQSWLSQSHLYDHFIDNLITQSSKSVEQGGNPSNPNENNNEGSGLNDPVIQAAAKQAFNSDLIEQSVNTFINSNYDWLKGNTAAPNFTIDLTDAKKAFAKQVGLGTQARLVALPKCTAEQSTQYNAESDPLTLPCLPPNLNPSNAAASVEQKLANSQDLLANPVITADNINPDGGKPYYTTLAKAPQYYQMSKYLPIVLGALALILGVIVFFMSLTRRKGLRRIGWVLLESGILLIATKFVADFVLHNVETKAFNNSDVGALQQSLSSFMNRAESGILGITLIFGIVYAVIGLAILIYIFATRGKTTKKRVTRTILDDDDLADEEPTPEEPKAPVVTDVAPRPQVSGPPPVRPAGPRPPKKRLIQL